MNFMFQFFFKKIQAFTKIFPSLQYYNKWGKIKYKINNKSFTFKTVYNKLLLLILPQTRHRLENLRKNLF